MTDNFSARGNDEGEWLLLLSKILVDFVYQRKEQDEAKGTNSVLSRVTDQEIYRRPCGGAIEASE